MARSDSQLDEPQRGCPKRAELPDVNIDTGAQSINTDRERLFKLGYRVILVLYIRETFIKYVEL